MDHPVETCVSLVDRDIKMVLSKRSNFVFQNNLSHEERQAITVLRKHHQLMIKPADKGGAIMVINKSDCIEEFNQPCTVVLLVILVFAW